MQKRSISNSMSVKCLPVSLDPDFPIHYSDGVYKLPSLPVTYLHYHSSLELGVCLGGSGVFYIGNQTFSFSKGDVSVIFPNVIHIAQSAQEDSSEWRFMTIDLPHFINCSQAFPSLDDKALYSGIISDSEAPALVQEIQHLMEELISRKEYRTAAATALINLIFVEILRYSEHKDIFPSFDPLSDRKIEKISPAILHITRHYNESVQIADLAALCNLSVTAFRRNFIAVMDVAPHEYLNRVRANMGAILLIKSALPVADIAYEVGCSSISTFNRIFKAFYHTTPISYRISQRRQDG